MSAAEGRERAVATSYLRWPLEAVFVGQDGVTDDLIIHDRSSVDIEELESEPAADESSGADQLSPVPASVPLLSIWGQS